MRSLRERPRVVVARALGVAVLLVAGIALGFLLDDQDADKRTEDRVQRIELVSTRRAELLDRTAATLQLERAELDEARRRAAALARRNVRLRRELRRTKRIVRSTQRARRSP
jgi:hypothetical protein